MEGNIQKEKEKKARKDNQNKYRKDRKRKRRGFKGKQYQNIMAADQSVDFIATSSVATTNAVQDQNDEALRNISTSVSVKKIGTPCYLSPSKAMTTRKRKAEREDVFD